jgi:hypothetical protein
MILFQKPNFPIVVAFCGVLLQHLFAGHNIEHIFYAITTAALLYWSYLEITTGVNRFRKTLGMIVFVFVGFGLIVRILR